MKLNKKQNCIYNLIPYYKNLELNMLKKRNMKVLFWHILENQQINFLIFKFHIGIIMMMVCIKFQKDTAYLDRIWMQLIHNIYINYINEY